MSGVFVRDLYFYMESGIKCIIIIIMSELKSNKKKLDSCMDSFNWLHKQIIADFYIIFIYIFTFILLP